MSGPAPATLDFVLVWHMHQPEYRDSATGEFRLPWVYLHAIKDYTDMAWHLERHPRARAVVNFVPVLLEQLEDYTDQFAHRQLRDPLLRLLARPEHEPFSPPERTLVLDRCFHANHHQMIAPFPPYRRLHELLTVVEGYGKDAVSYLSDRYLFDLLTWYHLSWTGETVRRESTLVTELMAAGSGFTHAQRLALLECIGGLVSDIIPRYRRLEARGQIELSTTPYFHPLAPLLIDFGVARDVQPELPLPQATRYPDGAARVAWHIRAALESHARRFGHAPRGMWPAEGAVCNAFVDEVARAGVGWTASGERVLANSLHRTRQTDAPRESYLYQPYRMGNAVSGVLCFCRDDHLSDLIGFEYRRWDGAHAAAHFVGELEAILARNSTQEAPIVSVILDGENAWEHYPYNGFYFLSSLYERLSDHPAIRMDTYRDWLDKHSRASRENAKRLDHVRAGSWVFGDLTTWIGSHDKNAAWDLLVSAKNAYDLVIASGRLTAAEREAAEHQLAICESSDWFWWFGDYNAAHAVASFDALYRAHLAELYRRLHLAAPASLAEPVSRGNAAVTVDGAMRRAV